jgi:hypothetical protein
VALNLKITDRVHSLPLCLLGKSESDVSEDKSSVDPGMHRQPTFPVGASRSSPARVNMMT